MVAALIIGIPVICAALGVYVASVKGRPPVEGVIFGGLLGPLGVIVVAMLPTLDVVGSADRLPPVRQDDRVRVDPRSWAIPQDSLGIRP